MAEAWQTGHALSRRLPRNPPPLRQDFFLAIRMGVNVTRTRKRLPETIGVLKESGIQLFDLSRGTLNLIGLAHPLRFGLDSLSQVVYAAKLVKKKH